uniref:Protein JTB n=1 Tax=Rhodnius prolixus TaxID=13249 RepID=T1HFL2_RHOPR
MIEFCSKKRMLAGIILLGGLTVIVLVYESQWAFEASNYNHFGNYSNLYKNLTDADFCWLNEEYSVVESCHPCSDFEVASKSNKACVQTQFKEAVKCHKTGKQVFRSCDKVQWIEEKKFWQFEVLVFVIALTSTASVFLRQRLLDQQHLKTLQRRLACSV